MPFYMTSRMKNGSPSSAFSLTELLVVITCIAILIAMLIPVVKMVKSSAQTSVCLNNLRQINLCILSYVNDNDGLLPPSGMGDGANFQTWDINLLLPYARELDNGLNYGEIIASGNSRSVGIYKCPAAPNMFTMSTWSIADYGLNDHLCAGNDQGNAGRVWMNVSLSSIRQPSETFIVSDTATLVAGIKCKAKSFCAPDFSLNRVSWVPQTLDYRHQNGGAGMGFLDGHVSTVRQAEVPLGTFRGWYLGNMVGGDFKGLYAPPWGRD